MAFTIPEKVFALRLNESMTYRGMSQADLQRATGIAKSQLSRYMNGNGKGQIPAATLFGIADALQCSARWLLGLTEDPGYEEFRPVFPIAPIENPGINEEFIYQELKKRQHRVLENCTREEVQDRVRLQEKLMSVDGNLLEEAERYLDYLLSRSENDNKDKH